MRYRGVRRGIQSPPVLTERDWPQPARIRDQGIDRQGFGHLAEGMLGFEAVINAIRSEIERMSVNAGHKQEFATSCRCTLG